MRSKSPLRLIRSVTDRLTHTRSFKGLHTHLFSLAAGLLEFFPSGKLQKKALCRNAPAPAVEALLSLQSHCKAAAAAAAAAALCPGPRVPGISPRLWLTPCRKFLWLCSGDAGPRETALVPSSACRKRLIFPTTQPFFSALPIFFVQCGAQSRCAPRRGAPIRAPRVHPRNAAAHGGRQHD